MMTKDDFYELLGIDQPRDFQFFENIAELLENPVEIRDELLEELLLEIDMETFGELIEDYFGKMEEFIPDEETEFYLLFENICRSLTGLSGRIHSEQEAEERALLASQLAGEIGKFREWYLLRDSVEAVYPDQDRETIPVLDALAAKWEEKLGGDPATLDFSEALDYSLPDFVMTFTDERGNGTDVQ